VIRVYAHAPSLSARGLEADDLVPGIGLINDKELAEILANCQAVMAY
jgi:sulfur relay (sulfurtransferase) DsrF/TusC family protein